MSSGGVFTDLTNAIVQPNVRTIYGQVMSRPALQVTDGKAVIWACDVNVGISTPDGLTDQNIYDLEGLPTSINGPGFVLQDTITVGTILRDVPIANNNQSLIYADVGNPVILQRTGESGQWQITGFSIEQPGTHTRYAVDLGSMTIGSVTDLSVGGRMLTLQEIGEYGGGWGVCPFGASGIFVGGNLVEVVG